MEEKTIKESDLQQAVNASCSCGGRGPNENECPACKVWHILITFAEGDKL